MDMNALARLQERTERLERRLRLTWTAIGLGLVAVVVVACATAAGSASVEAAARGAAEATGTADVLRARGLVLVDEDGLDRIAIGAPWPALNGRMSTAEGTGLLIVDPRGVDRLAMAAPTPDPPGGGQRIAPANGLTFYDPEGNERGGVGYLDNGRSVLVLDNDGGEGAAVYSFTTGQVGFALIRQGVFRASLEHDPETGATSFVMSDDQGRPRVRVSVSADGMPSLDFLDEQGNRIPR